ncbi:gluconate transporter, partial [Pseudoalteromonas sp. S1731]
EQIDDNQRVGKGTPSFGLALGLIAVPLIMISLNTIGSRFVEKESDLYNWLAFIAQPFTAILDACLKAFYLLAARRGVTTARIIEIWCSAVPPSEIIIRVYVAGCL